MKTPQEEAEVAVLSIVGRFIPKNQPESLKFALYQIIKDEIPLPQLIAVARAANGLSMGSDWNHGTHAKEHGYRQQLIDALQAIRATRKVEL